MHRRHRSIGSRAPVSRWSLLGRWLVMMVVVMDLFTSPLHAHAHDLGSDAAPGWTHAALDDADGLTHAESDLHPSYTHSVAALLPAAQRQLGAPVLWIVPSILSLALQDETGEVATWHAALDPIPISVDRRWRPEGRAPPLLHN